MEGRIPLDKQIGNIPIKVGILGKEQPDNFPFRLEKRDRVWLEENPWDNGWESVPDPGEAPG